jgi:hypothetical protein
MPSLSLRFSLVYSKEPIPHFLIVIIFFCVVNDDFISMERNASAAMKGNFCYLTLAPPPQTAHKTHSAHPLITTTLY